MSKASSIQKQKDKEKGDQAQDVQTAESPEKLVDLLITGNKERKRVADQVTTKGSKHKKLLTALLLQRLYKLVQNIEKTSGKSFVLQEGFILINENEKDRFLYPLAVPIHIRPLSGYIKTAKAMLKLPEHEALTYTMLIQVVEWVIKATEMDAVLPLPVLIPKNNHVIA